MRQSPPAAGAPAWTSTTSAEVQFTPTTRPPERHGPLTSSASGREPDRLGDRASRAQLGSTGLNWGCYPSGASPASLGSDNSRTTRSAMAKAELAAGTPAYTAVCNKSSVSSLVLSPSSKA